MTMTTLEASTNILLHCEDFVSSGSVKATGIQAFSSEPVATTTSTAKFGTKSLDVYTPNYGGLRFNQFVSLVGGVPATVEGWVYVRNFRSSARFFFGVMGSSRTTLFFAGHDSIGRPIGGYRDTGNFQNTITSASALTLNQWVHIAFTVDAAGLRRLFVDGTLVASSSSVSSGSLRTDQAAVFHVGGVGDSGGLPIDGCVDEVQYVFGYCLYTTNFTPPASPYSDSPAVDGAVKLPSYVRQSPLFSSVDKRRVLPSINLKDTYFGGRGQIIFTVKEKNTPINTPLHRKVWLVRERDAQIIRETWSDAVTGAGVFQYIDETQKYSVVSYDYLHNYRAVIADNLTPELMP